MRVAIVDYGMGNLFSVRLACEHAGIQPIVTAEADVMEEADALILPGVGAFGDAIKNLRERDLVSPIKDFIEAGKPFMGICLGMQLLLSESEEFGHHEGLDIIKGSVVKLRAKGICKKGTKVPQVGWNRISLPSSSTEDFWQGTLLDGLTDGEFMYFVHSYYSIPANEKTVLCTTIYGDVTFASGIIYKNINAFQFHPEKSGERGLRIYINLKKQIERVRDGAT